MRFTLTVDMDNDAFEAHPTTELHNIVVQAANVAMLNPQPGVSGVLRDSNGNRCGEWRIRA